MEIGQDVVDLPSCQHCFHKDCILKWIQFQDWCPFCRTPLDGAGGNEEDKDENDVNIYVDNYNDVDIDAGKDEFFKKIPNLAHTHLQQLNPAVNGRSDGQGIQVMPQGVVNVVK